MYIERVEIYGFKSFAKKTELVFGPGLCVVMGPNGVGKSNIFDAIRWAIGEQRLSLLRSSVLEDVIFDGSAQMRPLRFAEVSVQLADAEGLLPYDVKADKIRIVRRAFREGDSQFFINGAPMRLKDIRGILASVGLGDVGYAVIDKEMIAKIIDGSTEDRRTLFEQAAGIAKYKSDKYATQLKLKATQDDMVRVEDILREVSEQEAILKRQVRRARRYKKIQQDIREIELQLVAGKLRILEDEREHYSVQLESKKSEIQKISAELAKLRAEIQELSARQNETATRRDRVEQKYRELSTKISKNEREIAVLEERVKNSERTIENSKSSLAEIDKNVEDAKIGIEKANETLELERDRLAKIEKVIEQLEKQSAELDKNILQLRKQKSELDEKIGKINDEKMQLQNRIAFAKAETKKLDGQQDELENRLKKYKNNISELESNLGEIEKNLLEYKKRSDELTEELRKYQQRYSEILSALDAEKNRLSETKQEKSRILGRVHELEQIVSSGQVIGRGAHILSKNSQKFGIFGVVADLIDVKPEYSAVAERILGERIKFAVVENIEDAKSVSDKLPDDVGEVGFILLDELENSSRTPDWFSAKDERLASLVENTLIDDDFSKTPNSAIVSTDGKVIRKKGEVRIIKGEKPAGMITIRNQIDQLKSELEKIEQSITASESKISAMNDELTDIQKQIREDEKKSAEINSKLSAAQREQATISMQIEHFKQSLNDSRQSLEHIQEQIETNNKNIVQWQSELEKIEKLYSSMIAERDDFNDKITHYEQEHRRLDGEIAGKQVERVGIRGEIRTAENEIERYNITIADSKEKIAEIKKSVEIARTTIEDSNSRISNLKESVQELFAERDKVEIELEKIRTELDEYNEQISQKNRTEKQLSSQKDSIQEEISALKGKLSGNRAIFEQICKEAKSDFGEIPQPAAEFTEKDEIRLRTKLTNTKRRLEQSGGVNLEAEEQYESVKTRLDFLMKQKADINESMENLKRTIDRLDSEARRLFIETFERARIKFKEIFSELFDGGEADLVLKNPDEPLTSDISIRVKPAGKKFLNLSQLSAGEKSMTSLALLFGLYLVKPSPFCLMDEVDAPLDDANVGRFLTLIKKFDESIQFIIISHNKRTLEHADFLYGVSMEQDGVSRVVSIKMSDLKLNLE